ncbi:outer membrane channel lipoprotein [Ameyamaea chiangmaiensis NBRC 103196]|uniref:Efflux transporter outer membrane subunit n=1 Tax=Ameyamaea chiangmaiensis TaxID=442969 RepID=A0A850P2Z3_9PROT|nr:efflux transporter outer membrane subunit [Ameyamaea chiangmaiensis]MBS4075430.1 efflux transporter outer membrane subunit [Ameyamaea chiangmaiensis]NVN39037.1 efflux transporter outer membrane subunit [Ameyamaea chiangmaiensis]GBQ69789.1 outer membrane channel lipoprotein [Ameyamaea chiangmaiensis NBRC 103196]
MVSRMRYGVACTAVLWLAGCAVGPNFHRPAAPTAARYDPNGLPAHTAGPQGVAGGEQSFVVGGDIPAQWWTLFRNPALNALVERAIARNPSLASAQQALRAANQNVGVQEAALWPSISASFNPTRNKTSKALSPVPGNNAYLYNLHTAQLNISYSPDLWGGVRRQVEATRAQAEVQRYQMEAAYLTLTGTLVNAAIASATARDQLESTQSIIARTERILQITQRQVTLGDLPESALAAQRTLVAQARATLPPLQQQIDLQHDLIDALTGDTPDRPTPEFHLADFTLPGELPVSLPMDLVSQRPDIRASEAALHAASAQIGVAIANRLPALQLMATPGTAFNSFSQLAMPGYGNWMLAAMITQPLFEGFSLLHQERASRDLYQKAVEDYRDAVLGGVQEVADALHAVKNDADLLQTSQQADAAARHTLSIAEGQARLGDVPILMTLTAQEAAFQARLTLVQSQSARLSDTVGLFASLGGGWWNRPDVRARNGAAATR